MTTILFKAHDAAAFIEAAGALARSARLRGWRTAADVPGLRPGAAAVLGLSPMPAEQGGADLVFAARGAEAGAPPDRLFFFGGPLSLRVHEGLDAKLAALGAQRGSALCAAEARDVIVRAIACGTVTGAEAFSPASPAAEARLAGLLKEEEAA